jgi:protein O-GlcNAc transferase
MNAPAHQRLAEAAGLHRAGRLAEAAQLYDAILAQNPRQVDAINLYAQLNAEQGQLETALQLVARSLRIQPRQAYLLNVQGILLAQLKRPDDALKSLNKAILAKPDFAEALVNRGNVRQELKQPAQALADFDAALARKPDYADAWINRGNVLQELQRFGDAVTSYEKALSLAPDADAFNNCGNALTRLKRFPEALACYDQSLRLRPGRAEAYLGKGNAYSGLGQHEDAIRAYEEAARLKPDDIDAHCSLAYELSFLKRYDEAVQRFDRALTLDADHPDIAGDRLSAQMHVANWTDFDAQCSRILDAIHRGKRASSPSALLAIASDARTLRQCAEIYAADRFPTLATPDWKGERHTRPRIRIGYYSADFHNHATAHLLAGVIERHDRSRFEVIAFSFGPETGDAMQERLKTAFDRFHPVRHLDDAAIGPLTRREEIDIAIDLKGFTVDNRMSLFARRLAPIHVNYLGFPGTLGAPYIDYIIADKTLIPPEHAGAYSEKIVYLPHSYQPNDPQRRIAERTLGKAELSLPENGFVFCCFNNNYKITPDIFALWMRLLARIEGSVLWLLEDSTMARQNLQAQAQAHGIAPDRLIFAPRLELPEHLARHRAADLFLDTFYCNAHTTASDALWAGLPVLTWLGNTFTSRVAASLLNAVGLPELIAA